MRYLVILLFSFISLNSFGAPIKQSIYTPDAPAPIGTYSQGIKFGNRVYISGQIPIDPKTGQLVQGDFSAQINQVFANINAIAQAAGGTLDDILKLTIYLDDLSHFAAVNEAMNGYFHEPFPARAAIEIKALPKNASVEVEAIMGLSQE